MMKIESSSKLKTWRYLKNESKEESSQDLFLACMSFLVLLCVAVADATLHM